MSERYLLGNPRVQYKRNTYQYFSGSKLTSSNILEHGDILPVARIEEILV